MADETVVIAPPAETPATPNINEQIAASIWGEPAAQQAPEAPTSAAPAQPETPAAPEAPAIKDDIIDANEYLKQQLGYDDWAKAKTEIDELRKLRETAQTPAELKFANDEAKRYFEAIQAGKTDDLYNILHQQRQLSRLENLPVANATEAADILKANLQFKYKDLTPSEIDFYYNKRYGMPAKPQQTIGQEDADYQLEVEAWKQQVQEKEQEIIIEAKLAKPELVKLKSELVLPEIPKANEQAPIDPKVVEQQEAARNLFLQKLNSEYQNFKGFTVTAKDGEVELPVSFSVNPDELTAIKQQLENFNPDAFLDSRWFDENGNPKITQMQEDLYLLQNRDKIFQKIANESAAKRYEHQLKVQNNIKLNGVTQPPAQTPATDTQAQREQLAEFVWKL